LQENKIPIFEREGWQSQPSLSKIGILLIRRSLKSSGILVSAISEIHILYLKFLQIFLKPP